MRKYFSKMIVAIIVAVTVFSFVSDNIPCVNEPVVVNAASSKKSLKKAICGVYYGEAGSILVFFKNKKCDFYSYSNLEVNRGNKWSLSGNRLTWLLKDKEVYADITNGDTSTIYFKTTALLFFTATEKFTKISNKAKKLTVEKCGKLVKKHSNGQYKPEILKYKPKKINKFYSIGNSLKLKVNSSQKVDQITYSDGIYVAKPDGDDSQILIVNITIKNTGRNSKSISNSDFEIISKYGDRYSPRNIYFHNEDKFLNSVSIEARTKVTRKLAIEVPRSLNLKKAKLEYYDEEPIYFKII